MQRAACRASRGHIRVPPEIFGEALSHVFALRYDAHARGNVFHDFVHQQRVVRAAEDKRVDVGVGAKEFADALLYEIVRARRVKLIVLHQRHPHRASHARELHVRPKLMDFHAVRAGVHRAHRGEQSHVARLRERPDGFHRGADNAQHAAVGVYLRQVALLNGAQCLGRGGVAGQYHEAAAALEEHLDCLKRVLVNHLERVRPVRRAGIVAEIQIVVLRQQLPYLPQYRQSAIARVEHADRTIRIACGHLEHLFFLQLFLHIRHSVLAKRVVHEG